MASNILEYQDIIDTISKRQATREFRSEQIAQDVYDKLDTICKTFKPYDTVKAVLIRNDLDKLFKTFLGLERIKKPAAAIIFINKIGARFEMGYVGEMIILTATNLGLASCWTASSFNKKTAKLIVGIEIEDDEEIACVVSVGYAADEMLREKDRLDIKKIARRFDLFPSWAKSAVQAARLAPSAYNIQPCRYDMRHNGLYLYITMRDKMRLIWKASSRQIDLGIAAAHIFIIAKLNGIDGEFIKLDDEMSVLFKIEK